MNKVYGFWSLAALLPIVLLACSTILPRESATKKARADESVLRAMTFNVENLFDLEDDPEKNDEAFLPKSKKSDPVLQNKCRVENEESFRQEECLNKNWSKEVYERKLNRLTHVLSQVNDGLGPDILILQEVENRLVIEDWRNRYLKEFNYLSLAHQESRDERGIDTAILARLPLAGPVRLHEIDFSKHPKIDPQDIRPTRGILQADFRLSDSTLLSVFAVHFPSQGAKTEYREIALKTLIEIVEKLPSENLVLVGGDFNITAREDSKQKYFKSIVSPKLEVSHFVGCKTCQGSTYYPKDRTWSFFDVLLFDKRFLKETSSWRLNPDSIRVVNTSRYQINRWGSPARFGNGLSTVGVSDHWPLYAEIKYVKKPDLEIEPSLQSKALRSKSLQPKARQ